MLAPAFYANRLGISDVADRGGIFDGMLRHNGTEETRKAAIDGAMVALSGLPEFTDMEESEVFILAAIGLRRYPYIGEYAAVVEALRPFGVYVRDTFGLQAPREVFANLLPTFAADYPNLRNFG